MKEKEPKKVKSFFFRRIYKSGLLHVSLLTKVSVKRTTCPHCFHWRHTIPNDFKCSQQIKRYHLLCHLDVPFSSQNHTLPLPHGTLSRAWRKFLLRTFCMAATFYICTFMNLEHLEKCFCLQIIGVWLWLTKLILWEWKSDIDVTDPCKKQSSCKSGIKSCM